MTSHAILQGTREYEAVLQARHGTAEVVRFRRHLYGLLEYLAARAITSASMADAGDTTPPRTGAER